ncbi:putative proline-specific permease [compost metagenome]
MVAVVMFALMFVWAMIFLTHMFFRRSLKKNGLEPAFKIKGYPIYTVVGLVLMVSLMASTAMYEDFKLTLLTGVPFIICLSALYYLKYRNKTVDLVDGIA